MGTTTVHVIKYAALGNHKHVNQNRGLTDHTQALHKQLSIYCTLLFTQQLAREDRSTNLQRISRSLMIFTWVFWRLSTCIYFNTIKYISSRIAYVELERKITLNHKEGFRLKRSDYVQSFCTMPQKPPVGQTLLITEASRSYSDTPHAVRLLWTSDQPDAETST